MTCKRSSLKFNGKTIRLIKYRILRFFTSKRDRDINGMLNNVWKFCEPDYYNCPDIAMDNHVDIWELLKRRKIVREMSKNAYEPTSSKYPDISYYHIDQLYKLRMNQIYGIIGGKRR